MGSEKKVAATPVASLCSCFVFFWVMKYVRDRTGRIFRAGGGEEGEKMMDIGGGGKKLGDLVQEGENCISLLLLLCIRCLRSGQDEHHVMEYWRLL